MLADQGPGGVAERHARMHRMSREQSTRQRPLTAVAEQPCKLFEIDRYTLLVAVGARRADRENPQCLRSTVECRDQVPVNLVCGEALRLMRTEAPICDEDGALTDRCIRNQVGIDPYGDVQTDVLGIVEHQIA